MLLLAAFSLIERRAAQPILPLRLFADTQRNAAYGARVLFLGAMIGFFFFTTQFLQVVLAYPPSLTGLAFLPMTLVNFGASDAPLRQCAPAMGLATTLLGMALSPLTAAGVPLLAHRVTLALGSASTMLALASLLVLTCQARPPRLPPPSTAST